jgi:hypothetical protein
VHKPGETFSVAEGVVNAPLILTNGYLCLSAQPKTGDGMASYDFVVTKEGNYFVRGMANAPTDTANSFFVNVDAPPKDPEMIWDIEVTVGFEDVPVNWRGNGDDTSGAWPKKFHLTPGVHKLMILGREQDTELKSLTIYPID